MIHPLEDTVGGGGGRGQSVKNSTLRIASGSHKMSSVSHLHSETEVLPADEHLSLLCSQSLFSSLRSILPINSIVIQPSGPAPYEAYPPIPFPSFHPSPPFPDDSCPPDTFKHAVPQIPPHLSSVLSNSLPGGQQSPPDPAPLHRPSRTFLSYMLSDFSSSLQSYPERIGAAQNASCQDCKEVPHTTSHLFSCPAIPTNLTIRDLWEDPEAATAFLSSVPLPSGSFSPAA